MKRIIAYTLIFVITHKLFSDHTSGNRQRSTYLEELSIHSHKPEMQPFSIIQDSVYIGKSSFRCHSLKHRLGFSQNKLLGTYTYSTNNLTGASFGVGYMNSKFDFSHGMPFHQKHFHNLLLNAGTFTRKYERWHWSATLEIQMNTNHFSFSRYSMFTGLLNGVYSWHKKRNLYTGILCTTGLRYTRVLPIIGFDYQVSEKCKLNMVFPLNISAVYSLTKRLTADIGLRSFLSRQRLGKDEALRRGFVTYHNSGIEAGMNYKYSDFFTINLFTGETFGGYLRVSNSNSHHGRSYWQKPAPYIGMLARINF